MGGDLLRESLLRVAQNQAGGSWARSRHQGGEDQGGGDDKGAEQ